MEPLVEVHTREELARALAADARILGVNNRDLRTLEVRVETSTELIAAIPDECIAVCESGLRSHEDLARLRAAGFDAFLIGEHLMAPAGPGGSAAHLAGGVKCTATLGCVVFAALSKGTQPRVAVLPKSHADSC